LEKKLNAERAETDSHAEVTELAELSRTVLGVLCVLRVQIVSAFSPVGRI
jgi:hypothetical protein